MTISPYAGKPATKDMLVDLTKLEREYHERRPDLADPSQLVSFGTSGHRGSPLHGSFTEAHILAITQAICDFRRGRTSPTPWFTPVRPVGVDSKLQPSIHSSKSAAERSTRSCFMK
jgi:phosphoglucomutase